MNRRAFSHPASRSSESCDTVALIATICGPPPDALKAPWRSTNLSFASADSKIEPRPSSPTMCVSSTTTAHSSSSLPSSASRDIATEAFSMVVTATISFRPGQPSGRASGAPSVSPANARTGTGDASPGPSLCARFLYMGASVCSRSLAFSLTSEWNGRMKSARPCRPRCPARMSALMRSTSATRLLPPDVGAQYTRLDPSEPQSMAALCHGYIAPVLTPRFTILSTTAGGRPKSASRNDAGR